MFGRNQNVIKINYISLYIDHTKQEKRDKYYLKFMGRKRMHFIIGPQRLILQKKKKKGIQYNFSILCVNCILFSLTSRLYSIHKCINIFSNPLQYKEIRTSTIHFLCVFYKQKRETNHLKLVAPYFRLYQNNLFVILKCII